MRLYLVRHPKPLVAADICYGSTDLAVAAEAQARRQQWVNFIARRVLPAVNQALNSAEMVSYEVDVLTVRGSRTRTKITQYGGGIAWVAPLLNALGQPPYSDYTIRFQGTYRTGASPRSRGPHSKTVALDSTDLAAVTEKFCKDHPGASFVVEISL